MTNVHTLQETKVKEKREAIIAAERVALDVVDSMSEYNLSLNQNIINTLDINHRNNLARLNQIINKQPLLVQAEIAKKSTANEYLVAQILDKKILENTELTNDNKVLIEENNVMKNKLEENDLIYDTNTINKLKVENIKELEQMKQALDNKSLKKRELGKLLLMQGLLQRK